MRQRTYARRAWAGGVASALALSGLSVWTGAGAAHAANVVLRVAADGNDANNCRTAPCATLQRAVDVASFQTGRSVTIKVGRGTFTPTGSGVTIGAGSQDSLRISGAGVNATTLKVGLNPDPTGPLSNAVIALNIVPAATFPVTIDHLRITGSAPAGAAIPGDNGASAVGIADASTTDLTLRDLAVNRLSGGDGATVPAGNGGDGGLAVGIACLNTTASCGTTALRRIRITAVRSGDGAAGDAAAATVGGSAGMFAGGVLVAGIAGTITSIKDSEMSDIRSGIGGAGGSG